MPRRVGGPRLRQVRAPNRARAGTPRGHPRAHDALVSSHGPDRDKAVRSARRSQRPARPAREPAQARRRARRWKSPRPPSPEQRQLRGNATSPAGITERRCSMSGSQCRNSARPAPVPPASASLPPAACRPRSSSHHGVDGHVSATPCHTLPRSPVPFPFSRRRLSRPARPCRRRRVRPASRSRKPCHCVAAAGRRRGQPAQVQRPRHRCVPLSSAMRWRGRRRYRVSTPGSVAPAIETEKTCARSGGRRGDTPRPISHANGLRIGTQRPTAP